MAETITIDIDSDGNIRVEGHDFVGSLCKDLTREIEAALGTVVKETKKAAFHQPPQVKRKVSA